VSPIPREAREGLMRSWLAILKERHPHATWIAQEAEAVGKPVMAQPSQSPHSARDGGDWPVPVAPTYTTTRKVNS